MKNKKISKQSVMIKTPLKKHVINMTVQLLGAMLVCAGIAVFFTPNNLFSGGVQGLAMISNHFFSNIPVGIFVFVYNVPLIIWAWSQLERRFVFYTIWVILIESVLLVLFPVVLPAYNHDPLLACLFGGLLTGVGSGFIVKFYGSGGGLDVVGVIIKKRINISVGTIILVFNILVVLVAALLFDFERAMYTMVSMYVFATIFDKVLEGFSPKRSATIITEHGYDIAHAINAALGRGVTIMKAEGAYTHTPKDVLLCVISRFELPVIKEIIFGIDPNAFVSISESNEVMGQFNDISIKKIMGGSKK